MNSISLIFLLYQKENPSLPYKELQTYLIKSLKRMSNLKNVGQLFIYNCGH